MEKVTFFKKARTLFIEEKYELALDEINHAIQLDSNFSDAFLLRSQIYLGMNDTDRSCVDVEKFLGLVDSTNSLWKNAKYFQNKYCIGLSLEDYYVDLEEYSIRINVNSTDTFAYHMRGNLYFNYDSLSLAIEDYTIYLELYENPAIYYNRAICFLKIGEKEKACFDTKKAMSFDYKPVEAIVEYCD